MEIVAYLVCFNPDQPWLYPIDMADKLINTYIPKRIWNALLQHGEIVIPEKPAAADYIFPKTGLGLMDTQRNPFVEGRVCILWSNPLFIKGMAPLMQGAEYELK